MVVSNCEGYNIYDNGLLAKHSGLRAGENSSNIHNIIKTFPAPENEDNIFIVDLVLLAYV